MGFKYMRLSLNRLLLLLLWVARLCASESIHHPWNVLCCECQVDHTLRLTVGKKDVEHATEGAGRSVDDLVDGDGEEADGGVNSSLFVHDLNIEIGFTIERDLKRLIPGGVFASVLVSVGLLEGFWVCQVEAELEIRILLANKLIVV